MDGEPARMFVAAVLALVWWCGAACAAGLHLPPLDVPRCCPPGHRLPPEAVQEDLLPAADVPAACRALPDDDDGTWAPRVYAPQRGTMLPRTPPHWRLAYSRVPGCSKLRVLPEHAAAYALLANNASLLTRWSKVTVPTERYCADAAVALACAEDMGGRWLTKCCAADRVLEGQRCERNEGRAADVLRELREFANGSAVAIGFPVCARDTQYVMVGALGDARFTEGGELHRKDGRRLAVGAWCAEGTVGGEGLSLLACDAAWPSEGVQTPRHALYGVGLAVGAAFLAATLAAGFALPAAHHALHWRCQTHYVATLMLGDVLLAATQLASDRVPAPLCRVLAVLMHFLFLSAFFWLNTMCFNIWWTFRDFRPTSLERGQEACRLRVYMVYAWGGPLALAGAAAVLDRLPPGAAPQLMRPRFAVQRCWFYGDMEILVYFFGPVGVLLLINLALFISTTRQLTCGLWRRDEVKSTSERAALDRVCAKLVVVMGVTWGADVVSWAAGGPEYVWYATDLLNALQGVFIFLVVGCQPHAWAALKRAAAAWCARAPAATAHSSSHLPSCGESLTHTTAAPAPAPAPAPAARLPMETVC